MKRPNTMLTRCLCGLLLASLPLLAADKPALTERTRAQVPEPDFIAAWQRRIPELNADQLPLGEIINRLREYFPEINFIVKQQGAVATDLNSVGVRLRVRAVTLKEILVALELAAEHPIKISGGEDDRLVVFEAMPIAEVDPAGLPVRPTIQTRVFSLTRYLASRSDEEADVAMSELQSVLHTAGEMLKASTGGGGFDPKLHLHRGTKLLIAVGRPEELSLIEQVVTELQREAGATAGNQKPAASGPPPTGGATK